MENPRARTSKKLVQIGLKLVEAISIALGEKENFFGEWYRENQSSLLRFLRYPETPPDGNHTGCGAHSDYGLLTLLLQDSIGGLQVLSNDNSWINASPLQGSLVVNIGDCVQFMSNGVFKATKHKVWNNSPKDRYSIAFFFEPAVEMPIFVVKKFIEENSTQNNTAKPLPSTFGEHLKERLLSTYT